MAKKRAVKKAGKRKADPAQTYLAPDLEPPRIKELDKAALDYRKVRDERAALNLEEGQLKTKLDELMKKHDLKVYPIPDTDLEVAVVVESETVKVQKRSKPKKSGDGADGV